MKPHQFPKINTKTTSHFNEMNPAEIMRGLQAKNQLLTLKNEEYLKLAEKRAQAERNYNMQLAEQTLQYKAEGQSATLISSLIKGHPTVAKFKFDFDVAQAVEKACLESIKDIRSAIDTYRSLLSFLKSEFECSR
jgi:hypothetical protein